MAVVGIHEWSVGIHEWSVGLHVGVAAAAVVYTHAHDTDVNEDEP